MEVMYKRWLPGLMAATLVFGSAQAEQPAKARAKQDVEAEILRRLADLEATVAQFKEENGRLKDELAKRGGPAPAGAAAVPKAAKAGASGDSWDEPEVETKQEGRDEEARRRLTVLETQARKNAAEAAKRAEQDADKFKFELTGKYKVQYNSNKNFNLDNSKQQWSYDTASYFDQRFQLMLDASYESFLARLTLDQGNFVNDWKEDSEGTQARWGEFLTINSQLVRELFVQYTGPVMVRVGRQNFDVGNSIVLDGPQDALRVQAPLGNPGWGQTVFNAAYLAPGGGWSSYQVFTQTGGPPAGSRTELLGASTKLGAYYLDLDVRPTRTVRVRPYVLQVADSGTATDADLNLDKDFSTTTTPRDGSFKPRWLGVAFSSDGKPWKLDAEAVSLKGSITQTRKVDAYALFGRGERDIGNLGGLGRSSFGLEFGRGSGNSTNDGTTGTLHNFNALFLCRERHMFGNIFSQNLRAGYFFWDSNLSNITYAKFDMTFSPGHGLKLTPAISRMWTTEPVFAGAGPVGVAFAGANGAIDWSTDFGKYASTASTTRTTRDVGTEFDLNGSYPLVRNVDGFFSFGYFRPGAVYARPDGSNPNRALKLVVGAELKF